MSAPTIKEQAAIQEFRKRVKDILGVEELEDDYFLLRWLRARDLDQNLAEAMLRNAVKWRRDNKVDSVLDMDDPFFTENYPRFIGGRDFEGRPLYISFIGKWDVRTVVKQGKSQGFLDYTTQGFELLLKLIKKANKGRDEDREPVTQVVSIFDFEGFAWSQLLNYKAISELLQLASIYEAYYPEILYEAYFINAPSLISKIFYLLKPILAPKTMAKIKCFGTNKDEWLSALYKIIPEDEIPQSFRENN